MLLSALGTVLYLYLNPKYKIALIPRPNSGEFTTAEAPRLLPYHLEKCSGISNRHELVKNANNRFRVLVHVFRDGGIRVVDSWQNGSYGIPALEQSMVNFPRWGGTTSVLITADTDGWDTPEKKQVIDRLFQPAWEIYVVNGG